MTESSKSISYNPSACGIQNSNQHKTTGQYAAITSVALAAIVFLVSLWTLVAQQNGKIPIIVTSQRLFVAMTSSSLVGAAALLILNINCLGDDAINAA